MNQLPFLDNYPREIKRCRQSFSQVFIAALFIIAKNYKQSIFLSKDKWIRYIHTIEYHLTVKRNESLIHTTWMNFIYTMMTKRSQAKESTYCMIPFT